LNITEYRYRLISYLDPFVGWLSKIGLTPNQVTLISVLLGLTSAVFYATRHVYSGALLLFISCLFDLADGGVARRNNSLTKFGAAMDWIADKYVDGFVLIAIALGHYVNVIYVCIALFGSFINTFIKPVSYAEIGFEERKDGKICDDFERIGIFGRPETVITLLLFSILQRLDIAVIIIAIFTNISAVQRIIYLYRRYGKG